MNKKKQPIKIKFSDTDACCYPYLYENIRIVDHEIITDELAVLIGVLASKIKDKQLNKDLIWLVELVWDINGSVRGKCVINKKVYDKLRKIYKNYKSKIKAYRKRFTLPIGSTEACYAELIRNKAKAAVRTLYYAQLSVPNKKINQYIYDSLNVISNLFYLISLYIREKNNEEIKTYVSKSY